MIEEIKRHVRHGESFAFETIPSGRTYANMITGWRQLGYKVKLIFLFLPDVRIDIERVNCEQQFVTEGGFTERLYKVRTQARKSK